MYRLLDRVEHGLEPIIRAFEDDIQTTQKKRLLDLNLNNAEVLGRKLWTAAGKFLRTFYLSRFLCNKYRKEVKTEL